MTYCVKLLHVSMIRLENANFIRSNLHIGLNNFLLCRLKVDPVLLPINIIKTI